MSRHAAPAVRGPGERLVLVGAALFLLGLVAVVVAVVPVLLDPSSTSPDLAAGAAGVLLPLGLALALLGLLRGARARRRAARRQERRQGRRAARRSSTPT